MHPCIVDSVVEQTRLMHFRSQSLRQIPMHPNIIPLYDAFLLPSTKELYFVFECMEGNLYQLTKSRKGRPLASGLTASIFYQILAGLHHIHQSGYFHRDMKPENLLITTTGLADYPASSLYAPPTAAPEKDVVVVVKLADFGLARETNTTGAILTEYVSTRWYRAPEVLLRSRDYSNPVDMWALGTILVEVITLKPLFPGDSEVDQVYKICEVLGDPSPEYGVDERSRVRGGGPWTRGVKMAKEVGFAFPKVSRFSISLDASNTDCSTDDPEKSLLPLRRQHRPLSARRLHRRFVTIRAESKIDDAGMSRSSVLPRGRLPIRSLRRCFHHSPSRSSSVQLLPYRRSFFPIPSRTSSLSLERHAIVPETRLFHQRPPSRRRVRCEWPTLLRRIIRLSQLESLPPAPAADVGGLCNVVSGERASTSASVVAVELDLEWTVGRHAMGTRPALARLPHDSGVRHTSRSPRLHLRFCRRFDILRRIDFRRHRSESRVVDHVLPRQLQQLRRVDQVYQLLGRALATTRAERIAKSWSGIDAISPIRHVEQSGTPSLRLSSASSTAAAATAAAASSTGTARQLEISIVEFQFSLPSRRWTVRISTDAVFVYEHDQERCIDERLRWTVRSRPPASPSARPEKGKEGSGEAGQGGGEDQARGDADGVEGASSSGHEEEESIDGGRRSAQQLLEPAPSADCRQGQGASDRVVHESGRSSARESDAADCRGQFSSARLGDASQDEEEG